MKLEYLNQHIWDAYGNEYSVLSSTTQGYTLQDVATGSIFPFVDDLDKYFDKKMVTVDESEYTKLKELLDEAERFIKNIHETTQSFTHKESSRQWLRKYRGLKK